VAEPIAPAASGVGATLTRKVGPLPIWAYAVLAGVVLFAARAHVGGLSLPGFLGGGSGSGGGGGEGPSGGAPDPAAIASPGALTPAPAETPLTIAPPRTAPTSFASPTPIATPTPPTAAPAATSSSSGASRTLAAIIRPTVQPITVTAVSPPPIVASPRSAVAPATVDPIRAALGTLPLTPAQQAALGVAPLSPAGQRALGVEPNTPAIAASLGVSKPTPAMLASLGLAPVNINSVRSISNIAPVRAVVPITPQTLTPEGSWSGSDLNPTNSSAYFPPADPSANVYPADTVTPVRGPQ